MVVVVFVVEVGVVAVVAAMVVVVVVFVVDIQSSRRGICRGGSRRVRSRVERNCYRRELQPFF